MNKLLLKTTVHVLKSSFSNCSMQKCGFLKYHFCPIIAFGWFISTRIQSATIVFHSRHQKWKKSLPLNEQEWNDKRYSRLIWPPESRVFLFRDELTRKPIYRTQLKPFFSVSHFDSLHFVCAQRNFCAQNCKWCEISFAAVNQLANNRKKEKNEVNKTGGQRQWGKTSFYETGN